MPMSGISDSGCFGWSWLWVIFVLTVIFLIITLILVGVWWRLDA